MNQKEICTISSNSMYPLFKKGDLVYLEVKDSIPFICFATFPEILWDPVNSRKIFHRIIHLGPVCFSFGDNGFCAPKFIPTNRIEKVFCSLLRDNKFIKITPSMQIYSLGRGFLVLIYRSIPASYLKTLLKSLRSLLKDKGTKFKNRPFVIKLRDM